jgi:hypothetical protein
LEPAPLVCKRNRAPVFVVGSARSGTTLLYDMLLSSGGFALYLGESNIFNLVAPRFGDLARRANREQMLRVWLGSSLFRVSRLRPSDVESRILDECRNAGDFLRIVMDEVTRQQGAQRWAGNTPEEILHLRQIKKTIPEALVIHMIRDGRDVSVSLSQKRYIRPFPWKERATPETAALYWEWVVKKGRDAGAEMGSDYTEVRFEELVTDPRSVLQRLSAFLEHDLDYDRILKNAVGAVAKPNSSFKGSAPGTFNPVARWKQQLSMDQLTRIEGLVGDLLEDLGYQLATSGRADCNPVYRAWNRLLYRQFFELKLETKKSRTLRAFRKPLTAKDIDEAALVDEEAALRLRPPAEPTTGHDIARQESIVETGPEQR